MRRLGTGGDARAVVGAGTGVAVARGGDDDATERPIIGTALQPDTDAALAATAGRSVVATEVGDEEGYYEVEVELANGRHVDVHLDRNFKVIDSRADDDAAEDPGRR
jgi:hypothetical protein